MNPLKKILIIYTSVGLGHKVVAENIASALVRFKGIEVRKLDLLEMYRGPFVGSSKKLYAWIIKHTPWLWRFFYNNSVFQALTLPLRVPIAAMKANKLARYIEKEKPDLILSSHPTATALVSYLKKKGFYGGVLVTTFSDFHFQPYWFYPRVDQYFVMTREQKQELVRRGYPQEKIVITGLPINEAFAKNYARAEVSREFGLSRTKPLILVMGGSRGWGIRLEDVQALLSSRLDIEILVLVSLNETLYEALQELAARCPGTLKVMGNLSVVEVAKLFSAAKILVTKPGGLTIGQALLKNLPMVLVNPLPGMEELNQEYLLKRGLASLARDSNQLLAWTERLLKDKKYYLEIKERMKKYTPSDAAQRAAAAIIDILQARY